MTTSDPLREASRASVREALEAVQREIAEHDGWDMHPKDWTKLVQQHIDALGHPAPDPLRSPLTLERVREVLAEAEALLDRYREKARVLVLQTGGRYEAGEAIQFLVGDYDRHKEKLALLAAPRGEK
jgi:hypothetical protein